MPEAWRKPFMNVSQWDTSKSAKKLAELSVTLEGAGNRRVLVLCHNNPDPDSIASAMAFQFLLNSHFGIKTVLGYGGVVTRAENKAMVQRLRINMIRLAEVQQADYFAIALVDSQPGQGNNLFFGRKDIPAIVIDHHPVRKSSLRADFSDIRPQYGATSTIVTEYLVAAGITPRRPVANALLYGIKTDTNSLGRGASKQDFSAFRYLFPLTNPRVIGRIEKPPLSPEYFEDCHRGFVSTTLYRDVAVSRLGAIHSEAIIPELADLLLRMEGVSWSFCLGENNDLLILSLRSTSRSHEAGKVIRRLVGKAGSAGGHRDMAGGQIPLSNLTPEERSELQDRLVNRFLKIISRNGVRPRAMVHACPPSTPCT
jgi:nanoRNase/pAp phosphatase (c-di-AMP/oligoRNAs hydrolase)